jgi:hypothetical protein
VSRLVRSAAATLLICASGALSACGGGSDKPGYCADRSQLESSIKDLASFDPSQGLSGLESQLRAIQRNANALVASARSDFPSETSAIRSSLEALSADLRALPSSPSVTQIGALASDASSVVSAVRGFADASKSACD